MKEDIVKLAKELIRIPSVSGDKQEALRALKCAQSFLGDLIKPKIYEHNGVKSFLWSNSPDPMRPHLLLSAHLDVVDVGSETRLFKPVIEGSLLKGRGAGDMKSQAAVLLWCFKQTLVNNPKANIALLLTTDEEIGGFDGTRFVVDSGLKPDVVFIPDGGYDFELVLSEKAPHHFVLSFKRAGGHASRAFEVENPVNDLFSFYEEVRRKYSKADKRNPWDTTFEMTTIETDNRAKNRIPSEVVAAFSWRWPLEQIKFSAGRKEILAIAKKHHCKLVSEEGMGEGTLIDKNNDFVKQWIKVTETKLGRKIKFTHSHGASDARHFYNNQRFGTKNIIITSPKIGGLHANSEWIEINSLLILAETLTEYIETV